jgi:hypothetical protein
MQKNIYEILNEFSQARYKDERQNILRKYATPHFLKVLKYTFDPTIEFYVKEFPEDYQKPDTFPGLRYAGIESEIRRAYLFIKGDPTADKLTPQKRHKILLELLESFEYDEAKVFINMMQKDLKTAHLTKNLVKETFPNLF